MDENTPPPAPPETAPKGAVDDAALVLFSGGQDSATCLAWALARYRRVETLGFAYGQRHAVELACRAGLRDGMAAMHGWGKRLGPDHMIDLRTAMAGLGESALTSDQAIAMTAEGLPNTFVPGRNLLFLTCAAALAWRRGIKRIVAGMCETDYSGYPDCRDDTIKAMQVALNLGLSRRFVLETPLMWRDKAATWALAKRLGGDALTELIRVESHSCYLGDRTVLHPWGYGCGTCPACALRADGHARWMAEGCPSEEGKQG
ncbi:MAG: 7-cyano-7-deazaguanine synthase QueC [Rhodospirillales bacterium]|nr:7-cyano-7-deazaguanine synthase QueC [Rhodospirillales bacterium]